MIIGIDGNEANVERKVGIGEYAFELLWQFSSAKVKVQSEKFVIYLKEPPRMEMPPPAENWRYKIVGPSMLWTQFGLPVNLFVDRPKPDVFFTPSHYGPRFSPIKTVVSIMDVSYLSFPELFRKKDLYQLRSWSAYSVKNAAKVLTISKASKDDIISAYGVLEEKVVVTYPGVKKSQIVNSKYQLSMDKLREKYGIRENYILFVGTLQPRKNIAKLVEAFSLLLQKTKEKPQLLIVGKRGWLYESILSCPNVYGVEKEVKFLEFVSDEELQLLYQHALFFILPSLYEGFGLPVLEAMSNGCPVIVSSVSSLPEAGGKAALYVDPENAQDIAEKMESLVLDESLRKDLRKKGLEHVKKFSWEKAAKETLDVLQEVASQKTV